jgi:hypothetical protein
MCSSPRVVSTTPRVSLVTALQQEPENEALKDRLQAVYEALALEPP